MAAIIQLWKKKIFVDKTSTVSMTGKKCSYRVAIDSIAFVMESFNYGTRKSLSTKHLLSAWREKSAIIV